MEFFNPVRDDEMTLEARRTRQNPNGNAQDTWAYNEE
jgi:hypothetical protein